MGEPEENHLFTLGAARVSISDAIKAIVIIVGMAMAWSALQGRLESISLRLERLETGQSVFVRADVQNGQNGRIQDQLEYIKQQLGEIKKAVR